jgi:hypothetical protein
VSWTTRLFVSALIMLCLILAAHVALPARGSGAPTAPVGLTSQGRLLWNFEALLKLTFGQKQPLCVSGWNFTSGDCTPLAKYLLYWYTFQAPHGTVFHLVHRTVRPSSFGNYPVAVLIRGHMVACDARDRHFLIDYLSGAGLMLGCLAPQPK